MECIPCPVWWVAKNPSVRKEATSFQVCPGKGPALEGRGWIGGSQRYVCFCPGPGKLIARRKRLFGRESFQYSRETSDRSHSFVGLNNCRGT